MFISTALLSAAAVSLLLWAFRQNVIMGSLMSCLLFGAAFIYTGFRRTRQRVTELVHAETRRLLEAQETITSQLQLANLTLSNSEEKLSVTLNSIGDAVVATDAMARVTLLNPVAELLTGWTQAQAIGRPVAEIFNIIGKDTRMPVAIPVLQSLKHGTVVGLANHTVLISRDGSERDIADSCAPIRDRDGEVIGAVLVFRDVTEEYATQRALNDSSALIQTVLNTVADGIVVLRARDGTIEKANPSAQLMFGYAAGELIGRNFSLLIPELDREQRNDTLDYYKASDEQRASGQGREVQGRRRNGSVFTLEIAVSEMLLGGERYFTGILRDISLRKQAEAALVKAGALQNAIFNSANFSSIATDAKGVIQIFNVGAERMLGYTAAEVMNQITPADISDPIEVVARAEALSLELGTPITPGFEALAFKASRGIEDIYELTYIRKDGSRFPAVVSVTALRDAADGIIGYLLIGSDNTARKLMDRALQEKNIELESAKSVAEKANLAKSDFLSSMSHELRSPLNAILGFAQLIDTGSPPPTDSQKASIDQILLAGWYLLELINEVLDLALIESGRLSLSLEPVSLSEVLGVCEAMIEPQAKSGGIRMVFAMPESSCHVCADRTRVKQVLINLLSNAIKYNRAGGSVEVSVIPASEGRIRISIRDTGEGLAPEKIAQLFQPFNRLGQEGGVEEGTGIGLVVCKRLVELMDGKIGVHSTLGEGSVFWIELELAHAPKHDEQHFDDAMADRSQPRAGAQSNTLLYVEDNPANLLLVEKLLERRPDIRLLSARNGIKGIETARAALPDVILMDINLPGISGIEAMRILSADPVTAHIPVIALSANAMPNDIEKGLQAGFFRYLTKPIKVNQLMDTLDIALNHANPAGSAVADTPIAGAPHDQ
ncbi:MAG TPA: PAS domain S-box protein [Arenimonas sp.]|nr:PAS domain S-box protein [Arenimonas sp.]